MTDLDLIIARLEWADRLQKQAQEMRSIASRSDDPRMQRELIETAVRLSDQAASLLARFQPRPEE
jgi:hypothetical protein